MTMAGMQSPGQGDLEKVMDGTREFLGKLPVSEQDREKIAHLNAEKLVALSCP
jgi:hypothetical protein